MNPIHIQIAITLGAIVIAMAHLVWPNLTIDGVILILFVVAVIPWLAPLGSCGLRGENAQKPLKNKAISRHFTFKAT
ncbi:MAG: hypothetical protein HY260_14075 [Chloroflexi bacterium]|nr:hypothetical protein [Chloroflexota bacterium]